MLSLQYFQGYLKMFINSICNFMALWNTVIFFSSVQFSLSVVSDSLQHHEPQHARRPCSSPTPGVYSNSCPSNWWCHPSISSSVIPFSSCPQSFPASGSFPMSRFFASGGHHLYFIIPQIIWKFTFLSTQQSPPKWSGKYKKERTSKRI